MKNKTSEQGLIGCVLTDPSILEMFELDADDFYYSHYRDIYLCIRGLQQKGRSSDLLTVKDALDNSGKLEKMGGSPVLLDAINNVPSVSHFESYLQDVRDMASRRRVLKNMQQIEKNIETTDLAKLHEQLLELPNLIHKQVREEDLTSKDFAVDSLLQSRTDFTWGTPALDRRFSPLSTSKYVILAGETGVGKTTFALYFAIENALLGHKVLYLSLEMSNAALLVRYARSRLGISKMDWKEKNFNDQDIKNVVNELPKTLIFKKSDQEVIGLEWVRDVISGGDYDMVFIDNFGFIDAKGNDENDKFKNVSRAMVELVKKLPVVIVALHHFRKGSEKASRVRNLNALMGTAKLSHDIDFCLQVSRDLDNEDSSAEQRAELSVILQKDREWGEFVFANVYFRDGQFFDSYAKRIRRGCHRNTLICLE